MPSEPTVIIGGAQKAGTTSLFNLLGEHPDVFASSVKEPGYFAFCDREGGWEGPGSSYLTGPMVRGWDDYRALFAAGVDHSHRLEASTLYLSEPDVPERLARACPDVKLIFVLRDPAERLYSNFSFLRLRGLETHASVLDGVQAETARLADGWAPFFGYTKLSSYADHLSRFFDVFSERQILCLSYRGVADRPAATIAQVEAFLGLPSYSDYEFGIRHNPGGKPRLRVLQRAMDFQAPRLRGRMRRMAPKVIRRTVAGAREWNLQRDVGLSKSERQELIELLRPQILGTRDLVGSDMTAGWDRVEAA